MELCPVIASLCVHVYEFVLACVLAWVVSLLHIRMRSTDEAQ